MNSAETGSLLHAIKVITAGKWGDGKGLPLRDKRRTSTEQPALVLACPTMTTRKISGPAQTQLCGHHGERPLSVAAKPTFRLNRRFG